MTTTANSDQDAGVLCMTWYNITVIVGLLFSVSVCIWILKVHSLFLLALKFCASVQRIIYNDSVASFLSGLK